MVSLDSPALVGPRCPELGVLTVTKVEHNKQLNFQPFLGREKDLDRMA